MQTFPPTSLSDRIFAPEHFQITTLDDEIRVDQLCVQLLRIFCRDLIEQGLEPLAAGELARGADYFLRDFMIAECRKNIFTLAPGQIRQFGGNWYIVRNLEPNLVELGGILKGVAAFYRYCLERQRISPAIMEQIDAECALTDYFSARIERFWAISGDGYQAWVTECPLETPAN